MIVLHAAICTQRVLNWFQSPGNIQARHVFENSCSLLRTDGSVLSIVNPAIGPGPFNLVLAVDFDFTQLDGDMPARTQSGWVEIGEWRFDTGRAAVWDPRPDWSAARPAGVGRVLPLLEEESRNSPIQTTLQLKKLADLEDAPALLALASRIAGLGPGLTPAGDDALMGIMYALWLRVSAAKAARICARLAETAAARTTTLSGAWLRAASAGEAGADWHRLVDGIAAQDQETVRFGAREILNTGQSSGADALAGFIVGLGGGLE